MNDMTPTDRTDAVPVSCLEIAPENPRSAETVDAAAIATLAENIDEHGVLMPLICYEEGGTYFVTAGGRRLRALRLLAETRDDAMIPVLCTGKENAITLGAAEQLSHIGMNPADELRVYANPAYRQLKPAILARLTGRSVAYVKQRLAVLRLPEAIVTATLTGLISVDQACGLTYFEDDEAGLSAMFERCMNDRRLDGDNLRAMRLREISEWSEHPYTAYVSREDYLSAGGRLQEDLFSDATLILSPTILGNLAEPIIEALVREKHPGGAFYKRLDADQRVYDFRAHHGIPGGTSEQHEWLQENPHWRIDEDDVEAVERHAEYTLACEPRFPDDLVAMLGVVWRMNPQDKTGFTSRGNIMPEDTTPLIEAGHIEPVRELLPDDVPEGDEMSSALVMRIRRIKHHALVMELAAQGPDAILALYLTAMLRRSSLFHVNPEASDAPDEFLRVEPGAAFVKLLDFYGLDTEAVAGLKPAEQRKALAYQFLTRLSLAADTSQISAEQVRKYWTPRADFLAGYKRPALEGMITAHNPDDLTSFSGQKKSGLCEYLASVAAAHPDWLPVGFDA